MQGIRKAIVIVGGSALMALMLGLAAFAFTAAMEPSLFAHPGAIVVGFAATANAQPAAVGPIVTNVSSAATADPAPAQSAKPAVRTGSPVSAAAVSTAPKE